MTNRDIYCILLNDLDNLLTHISEFHTDYLDFHIDGDYDIDTLSLLTFSLMFFSDLIFKKYQDLI